MLENANIIWFSRAIPAVRLGTIMLVCCVSWQWCTTVLAALGCIGRHHYIAKRVRKASNSFINPVRLKSELRCFTQFTYKTNSWLLQLQELFGGCISNHTLEFFGKSYPINGSQVTFEMPSIEEREVLRLHTTLLDGYVIVTSLRTYKAEDLTGIQSKYLLAVPRMKSCSP